VVRARKANLDQSHAALIVLLHRQLGLQIFNVAENGSDCKHTPFPLVSEQAVLRLNVPIDFQLVPGFSVAYIVDSNIVVLTPEERNRIKGLVRPKHVPGRRLSLPLGHDPVLDADLPAGEWVWPTRDVACREDAGGAGFQVTIDDYATLLCEPGRFRELEPRPHPDAGDN
jgi:hypothetical protein